LDEEEVTRTRKLLLNSREISKISTFIQQKGYTLIPLSLYWKRGNVKIQIGLAKGRKKQDKRALIKERDWKLDKERLSKQKYNR
jgi:SsrA-binding protein